ncbi:beta-mannosidase, putative [Talaromyces stipitatus ATCC 10500]|uniref:Beta-mannosidase B n=1 Tax=Talaromyces stipitatus (strain ATCC 10500 / CBS 375.48 / QM 6759 / NRRL 1006) TaxID=441959 RepID=B8M6W5_TALSN|nr:beta-mannosidase, putative [Talaromyces stipitatus ATCC 10500]EED20185.1 beta-mannosidase, putative [Talaromyces stipitatus ATCC 10500]
MAFFEKRLSTGWTFRDVDDEGSDAWMPVPSIPSTAQQDLIANNKLENPYIGFNELKARWVNEKSWIYRHEFEQPEIPADATVALVFDGLDTFASVTLDGQKILESDNMFMGYRVNITDILIAKGPHVLEIKFDCAQFRAREIRSQHPDHKWVGFNGDMARLAVRKAQYHWGWDWGPVIMTAGIWREVRLEVYSARVADLWPQITSISSDHQKASVTMIAKIDAAGILESCTASFRLTLRGQELAHQDNISVNATDQTVQAEFQLTNPELWWPHGYGSQTLYEVSISLWSNGKELHKKSKRFGIRSAEVIQQPDKHGKSFFFRINGVDIFCGGSCWIPTDSLLPSITAERYRKWIELMVAGGQMMIRVWGGGIYEDDRFYEVCDELGVLVWQDFMFGCGNYPVWPRMRESIRQEAIYNVQRLRHHPSIVIYVGNNEDYQVQEQAKLTYHYDDKNPENWLKTDFPARYIYEKILLEVVAEHSPGTFYHPGSPWGDGKITSDPTVGDMHQWNVWHGSQEKYQIFASLGGRFNSEFGMEAFPHMSTIEYFVENEADKFPQSHVLDFHNKADGHERRLATYLVENVRTATDLETYIYLTQVIQAETMMFGYTGWRRQWGDERHCGGALLWQLNDCWPTISWSIVDYFLRPKPAYYTVKRALKSVAIGVRREHHDWSVVHAQPPTSSRYDVWIASSRQEVLRGKVELRFISVVSGEELRSAMIFEDIVIKPNGTTNVLTNGMIDHIAEPEPHVLSARLWVGGDIVARDIDWPQPFKYLDFSDRGLEVKPETRTSSTGEKQQILKISAQRPVKCLVFEERDNVRLSDSAMDIVPGDEQVVIVTGLDESSAPLKYRYLGQ